MTEICILSSKTECWNVRLAICAATRPVDESEYIFTNRTVPVYVCRGIDKCYIFKQMRVVGMSSMFLYVEHFELPQREKNLRIHCTLDSIHLVAGGSEHTSKINRVLVEDQNSRYFSYFSRQNKGLTLNEEF